MPMMGPYVCRAQGQLPSVSMRKDGTDKIFLQKAEPDNTIITILRNTVFTFSYFVFWFSTKRHVFQCSQCILLNFWIFISKQFYQRWNTIHRSVKNIKGCLVIVSMLNYSQYFLRTDVYCMKEKKNSPKVNSDMSNWYKCTCI